MEQKCLSVSEAVSSRIACRDFLPKEVSLDLIMKILNEARRAPSSGNIQPWKIYLIHGETRKKLTQIIKAKTDTGVMCDIPLQFQIYPGLTIPAPGFSAEMKQKYPKYYQRYSNMGKNIYTSQGVKRGDFKKRMEKAFRAYDFFGAPVGLIFTVDKAFGLGQYPDLGIMLQTIMLLCQQYGLSTCGQVMWSLQHKTLRKVFNINENELIFCGMAIGYKNDKAPVNQFKTERMTMDEMVIVPEIADMDNIQFESHLLFRIKMAKLMLTQYYMPKRFSQMFVIASVAFGVGYWFKYVKK